MTAFKSFLLDRFHIEEPPEDLGRERIFTLLAEFVKQARKTDGTNYQRGSLIDMIRSIIRSINAVYTERVIAGKEAPSALTIKGSVLLETTLDSVAKQLTAEGKGQIQPHKELSVADFNTLLDTLHTLEKKPSCLTHTFKSIIIMTNELGLRINEMHKLVIGQFERGTDAHGTECIIYSPDSAIKQHQGGIKQGRGVQQLAQVTTLKLYAIPEKPAVCPLRWFAEHESYVQKLKPKKGSTCNKLFLQLSHTNKPKADPDPPDLLEGITYHDAFVNGPLGINKLNAYLQLLCRLAGIEETTMHGMRRTFIISCYRAGMPEVAIMRISRHVSVEGLRCYAGIDDSMMAKYASDRHRQLTSAAAAAEAPSSSAPKKLKQVSSTESDLCDYTSPNKPACSSALALALPPVAMPPAAPIQQQGYMPPAGPFYNAGPQAMFPAQPQYSININLGSSFMGGWQQQQQFQQYQPAAGGGGSMAAGVTGGWPQQFQQYQPAAGGGGSMAAGVTGGWPQQFQQYQPAAGGGGSMAAGITGGWPQQFQQQLAGGGAGGRLKRRFVIDDDE